MLTYKLNDNLILSSTIEKQQNLAKECMGDEAEAYFKGVQIYEFPLKYW